jgi:hypothetical protein
LFDKQSTVEKNSTDTFTRLVAAARIVKPEDLTEAQKSAKQLNVSVPRALIMLKFASENSLRAPMQADELVRKGKLTFELALKAVVLARQNGLELEDAINVMGAVVHKTQNMPGLSNPLTELMIASDMLTQEQLGQAVSKSQENQMSLGPTLVVLRFVSRWALNECVHTQLLVKENKINRDQAVNALKSAARRRISVFQVLFESGQYCESTGETLRLAELFMLAGIVSESDYLECIELEVSQDKPFSQVILEKGLVEPRVVEAGTQLLDMIGSVLLPFQAADALRQVRTKNITHYQAMAELQPPPQVPQRKLRLGDLVTEAGLASREIVEEHAKPHDDSPIRIGKRLLAAGVITEPFLYNALRCQSLAREGLLSADNAVTALTTCRTDNSTLEEALQKLSWHPPARMHWSWV